MAIDGSILIIVFALFLGTLALGVPITVSAGIAALSAWFMIPGFPASPGFVFRNMVAVLDSTPFLAIPLFILSGNLMAKGGISGRLFDLFSYFVGNKTGGLPAAVIVTTFFYGSFTGSAPATVAAVGAMTIPLLVSLGYNKVFVTAMVVVPSGLAIILPPSVPMIVFGMSSGTSIGDLFIAGILPGILVAAVMVIYVVLYFKIRGGEDKEKLNENFNKLRSKGFFKVFKDSILALLCPFIILGGIYSGIVTPTEAANISVVYALILSVLVYRTISLKELPEIFKDSASTTAKVFVIISTATVLGRVLTLMQAPQQISAALMGMFYSDVATFIVILLFLITFGLFMEPLAVIIITTPIFFPIVTGMGINPVHFGVLMIFCSAIGFVTPPVGMSLFVATSITKIPLLSIAKQTVQFLVLLAIVMVVIILVPEISLILLR
ncbi:MAG: TRAP transporter large permease [Spirochaetes bacterium]|nr:TRAP transporter large permease [Spirochaetota bacterium]